MADLPRPDDPDIPDSEPLEDDQVLYIEYDEQQRMKPKTSLKEVVSNYIGSQHHVPVVFEEEVVKGKWGNKLEFLMSCIASAVGLGNVWRFPSVLGKHGGGSFLIPYIICITFIGAPLYYLELYLGQFTSRGPMKVWEMAPLLKGIGLGSCVISFLVCTYYVMIMAWTLGYLFFSFYSEHPWHVYNVSNMTGPSPYFSNEFLRVTDYFANDEFFGGLPACHLILCLLVSWLLIWAVLLRGVSSAGKSAYVTALFPFVILFTLLGRAIALPNAWSGIKAVITPEWDKMLQSGAWIDAIGQCFFSLGVSFGGCIMFSSFNDFHHHVGNAHALDVLIITAADFTASFTAGLTIFAALGNLHEGDTAKIKEDALKGGAGLAFTKYPIIFEKFGPYPLPHIFSVLFFTMLLTLALGSANGFVGTVVTMAKEYYPRIPTWKITTAMALLCIFIGIFYCTPNGPHIIDLVDLYGANFVLFIFAMFETIGVAWVYGLRNISKDFAFMKGNPVNIFVLACWGFIIPILCIIIFFTSIIQHKFPDYFGDVPNGFAVALTLSVFSIIPGTAIYVLYQNRSANICKMLKATVSPSDQWGPADRQTREEWIEFKKTYSASLIPPKLMQCFKSSKNKAPTFEEPHAPAEGTESVVEIGSTENSTALGSAETVVESPQ